MRNTKEQIEHAENHNFLVGKTVKGVRYLTNEEMEDLMWSKNPLVIEFTDGTVMLPMMDDEGNDGGSLHYQNADGTESDVIYTI